MRRPSFITSGRHAQRGVVLVFALITLVIMLMLPIPICPEFIDREIATAPISMITRVNVRSRLR